MNRYQCLCCATMICWSLCVASVQAAPVTGGTGPGGFGTTDGTSSLEWWLKADAITGLANGQVVGSWNDQSGNGRNVTGNGQVWQITVQNNLPAILFSAGQTPFRSLTSMTAGTVYVVAQYDPPTFTNYQGVFNANGADDGSDIYFTGNAGGGGQTWWPQTQLDGRYVDGSLQGVTIPSFNKYNILSGTDSTPTSFSDWTIGRDRNIVGREWQGHVSEVIVHDRVINQAERIILDNHMSAKYNIALDISGANTQNRYSGDDNAKGDYDFGVFGVLNVGGVSVTNSGMDGFGIEAMPGVNQGALAGYSVLNNSILNTVTGLGDHLYAANRWDRSWYVDSSESFGATLAFNAIDAGLASLDPNESYYLIHRDTLVGDWSALGQGTVSGDTITFQVDTLLSGYYTIAFNITYLPEPSSLTIFAFGAICLASRSSRRRQHAMNGFEAATAGN